MLGEFRICGFHVFWQRTIMETDCGILYYALFVCFVTKDHGDSLREFSLYIIRVLMLTFGVICKSRNDNIRHDGRIYTVY